MDTSTELEKLYTIAEAMDYLRISRPTIQRFLDTGKLAGCKVGGTWRFTKAQMNQLIQPVPGKHAEQTEQGEASAESEMTS